MKFLIGLALMFSTSLFSAPISMFQLIEKSKDPKSGVKFFPMPMVRQARDFTCGAAALQSVFSFYGDEMREGQLVVLLKTHPVDGTSYGEIIKLINKLNSATAEEREKILETPASDESPERHRKPQDPDNTQPEKYIVDLHEGRSTKMRAEKDIGDHLIPVDGMSTKEIEKSIDQGIPVMVLLQAYGDPEKYENGYEDGHFVNVIGYDKDNFYFMDPSSTSNFVHIPKLEFVKRWHDESKEEIDGTTQVIKVSHFGLRIYQNKPVFNLDSVPKMD